VSSGGETDEGLSPAGPQKALNPFKDRRRGPSSDPSGHLLPGGRRNTRRGPQWFMGSRRRQDSTPKRKPVKV